MPSTARASAFNCPAAGSPRDGRELQTAKGAETAARKLNLVQGENLSTCQGKDGKLDFDAAHSFAV